MEDAVNSYSYFYKPFEPANMVYYGEKDRIKAIQVPFAVEPTRNADAQRASPQNRNDNAQRASPQTLTKRPDNAQRDSPTKRSDNALRASPEPLANGHGGTNNLPNEGLGVQAQGVDVSLPTQVNGLRRSSRKRNDAIYNEDLLANRLPRLSRPRGASSKKKPVHCLRMRASNHYPIDSDLDDSEPDSE